MNFSRIIFISCFGLFLLFLLGIPLRVSGEDLGAQELVRKMDDLMRGGTSYMKMKMIIHNPDWRKPREFEMFSYDSRNDGKAFIRITAPARDRGSGFLKISYNLWMYVPRTERVMKVPPSMMHQSWMGSDFTNDDLVRESSIVKDYDHKVLGVEDHPDGGRVYHLELLPRPEAPVVWGKILLWVRDQGFIPTKQQYFDEDKRLVNEMLFLEARDMGGRRIPTVWEMRSMTKPGHRTVLEILEAKFDIEIDPGIFTERNLKTKDW
jgi:outer membrane lipoprotein-sorting protein